MARLSKNGAELLRISKEVEHSPEAHSILRDGTDLGLTLTTWERVTRVYCSNGKILEKHDVRFRPDSVDKNGRFYSYGWKVYGTVKKDRSIADLVTRAKELITTGKSRWVIENGGPAPVIISQDRILRAIESGDSVGFCKACGAEAYGVEPDACNYACESCGAHEVYGAEEMLIAG